MIQRFTNDTATIQTLSSLYWSQALKEIIQNITLEGLANSGFFDKALFYGGNRVKGRDFYDWIFYTEKNLGFNLQYLVNKLVDSGHLESKDDVTENDIQEMLVRKVQSFDIEKAKDDVRPFLHEPRALDTWNRDFFLSLIERSIHATEGLNEDSPDQEILITHNFEKTPPITHQGVFCSVCGAQIRDTRNEAARERLAAKLCSKHFQK